MIEFESVAFHFDGTPVLRGLDLHLAAGERLALLGRSGSGKSTILRLVNALLLPDAGQVRVEGQPTSAWQATELRRRVGYIIQDVGLFPHFNVADNVGLVPRLIGWESGRVRARVEEMLERVGLPAGSFGSRYPHQLSGGQRGRVGIARALAAEPAVLLCDEPFGSLDPITRYELQRAFRDLSRRSGTTLLFVTHDVREALFMSERIALLDGGTLVFDGPGDEFRSTDQTAVRRFREAAL